MKNLNYFIIGVDYNDASGVTTNLMKNITSPGMLFYASDGQGQSGKENLYNELLGAFSYANCMCPSAMIQFITFNETTGNAKYYADCFQGDVAPSFAKFAEVGCEHKNGTLVSLTSQEKENFIYRNLQDAKLLPGGASHFHIGLTSTNGSLSWYNYNKTQIPLGSYTNWASGTGTGDYCVFTENLGPNKWGWLTEACVGANPYSYVCQIRACDADDDCEIDQLYKREQKQNSLFDFKQLF
uniref:C-type lectin domain-containing protein n=1 Tax=Acrobeloides nanus TaxID=290746 RepID=A0A914CKM9_9BILA